MSAIKVNVSGYDEASQSLLVSFASDKTKSQNPADYPAYAIQASAWGGSADIEQIKLAIARVGVGIVQAQESKEQAEDDPTMNASILSLVGQQFSCALEDVHSGGSYLNEVTL
jgi:hypothetical protein